DFLPVFQHLHQLQLAREPVAARHGILLPKVYRRGLTFLRVKLVALAIVLGVGSAIAAVEIAAGLGSTRAGAWTTSATLGSGRGSLYERAAVAVHALFVLERSQALYFQARADDRGARLDGRCRIEVRGRPPPSRWWSITAYGADDFLIPNAEERYSFSGQTIALESDGSFAVRLGSRPEPGNWLPTGGARAIKLTLRLYGPAKALAERPGEAVLPAVKQECP
ncbi:MAG: DUF1214 domain-containing protein, partial [Myxococcales bacterium]